MKFCCPTAWSSELAVFKRLRAGWVKETKLSIKLKTPDLDSLHFLTHLFLNSRPFRQFLQKDSKLISLVFLPLVFVLVLLQFLLEYCMNGSQGNWFKSEPFPHKTHSQSSKQALPAQAMPPMSYTSSYFTAWCTDFHIHDLWGGKKKSVCWKCVICMVRKCWEKTTRSEVHLSLVIILTINSSGLPRKIFIFN